MKRRLFLTLTGSSLALSTGLYSCTRQQENTIALTVSAAAVFRNAMAEIEKLYQKLKPNIVINYNITSVEVLKKQIEQGAPVDVYIPASTNPMNELQAEGLILQTTRTDFVKNEIVLIALKNFPEGFEFKDITSSKVKRVALGSKNIGAGIYAKQILDFLQIYDQVKAKCVFEEQDVQQILKYVETGEADVGITFLTEAKRSDKVKILAIAPPGSHTPAISSIAVIKNSKHVSEAKEFIKFVTGDEAKAILKNFGFININ